LINTRLQNETIHFGITLDLWTNRKIANFRLHIILPVLNHRLNLKPKLQQQYKAVIRTVWSYGIQMLAHANPSNTRPLLAFQNISSYGIDDATWCLTNNIKQWSKRYELVKLYYKRFHSKFIPIYKKYSLILNTFNNNL